MIFVHGFVGSGGQFESQGMRFTSNGYPADSIGVEEYDSTFATTTMAKVWDELDGLIARLLAQSGADKVELVGHSLGTAVSQGYLKSSVSSGEGRPLREPRRRAGRVATCGCADVGGVGRGELGAADRRRHQRVPARPQPRAGGHLGRDVRRDVPVLHRPRAAARPTSTSQHHVSLSGRADLFPSNAGAAGTTLQIWEVERPTGFRKRDRPEATFSIGADGAWGPFRGSSDRYYELAILLPGSTHHFYFEPFIRSDRLVRLLTQPPGTGLDAAERRARTPPT